MTEAVTLSAVRQRLEPFLLLAKATRGAATAELVKDVLCKSGVYVFAELLDLPQIKELEKDEQHRRWLEMLRLFSYGTYKDYKESKDNLPTLNEAQLNKLKHLSIVSLSETARTIPYATLMDYLDISNVRELEDLIIEAIYQDVIKGKLDQKKKQLEIEYTMGRDVRPERISQMLDVLGAWSQTSEQILKTIDDKITQVRDAAIAHKQEKDEYERDVERARKDASKTKHTGTSDHMDIVMGSTSSIESYDYSEESGRRTTKSKGRRLFGSRK